MRVRNQRLRPLQKTSQISRADSPSVIEVSKTTSLRKFFPRKHKNANLSNLNENAPLPSVNSQENGGKLPEFDDLLVSAIIPPENQSTLDPNRLLSDYNTTILSQCGENYASTPIKTQASFKRPQILERELPEQASAIVPMDASLSIAIPNPVDKFHPAMLNPLPVSKPRESNLRIELKRLKFNVDVIVNPMDQTFDKSRANQTFVRLKDQSRHMIGPGKLWKRSIFRVRRTIAPDKSISMLMTTASSRNNTVIPQRSVEKAPPLTVLEKLERLASDLKPGESLRKDISSYVEGKNLKKIGEGTFAEVFSYTSNGQQLVVKFMPILGSEEYNGEMQKTLEEVSCVSWNFCLNYCLKSIKIISIHWILFRALSQGTQHNSSWL